MLTVKRCGHKHLLVLRTLLSAVLLSVALCACEDPQQPTEQIGKQLNSSVMLHCVPETDQRPLGDESYGYWFFGPDRVDFDYATCDTRRVKMPRTRRTETNVEIEEINMLCTACVGDVVQIQ